MDFFTEYFGLISGIIKNIDSNILIRATKLIKSTNEGGGKIILAGNGGSAAIASHISVDFTNAARIRAINFNESDLITCLANDYGYERWLEKAIEFYGHENDAVILISSSGRSENIINAAIKAKELGMDLITLSGFDTDNPLKQMGCVNFWIDSQAYNVVETVHNIWLAAIVDKITDDTVKAFTREKIPIEVLTLAGSAAKPENDKAILQEPQK